MFVEKANMHLFYLPLKNQKPFLFPQFLKPESKFEKFVLISNFIFSKYQKIIQNIARISGISIQRNDLEFLQKIPIKTQKLTLVHYLNDQELEILLQKLRKIKSDQYIRKTSLYFLLLPLSAFAPEPLGLILGLGFTYNSFKCIRETRGSLVMERIFSENNFKTKKFNLKEIEDLEKFKDENNLHLL